MNSTAKKTAYCGMLTALAMIFSYVESLIPISFGVPGIKLGLANLVVLSALYFMSPGEVLAVSAARILLLGFLFGNGLIGACLGFALVPGVDFSLWLCGLLLGLGWGAFYTLGPILVAALVLQSAKLFYYLPVLILSGLVTGVLIGILGGRIRKILAKTYPSEKKENRE